MGQRTTEEEITSLVTAIRENRVAGLKLYSRQYPTQSEICLQAFLNDTANAITPSISIRNNGNTLDHQIIEALAQVESSSCYFLEFSARRFNQDPPIPRRTPSQLTTLPSFMASFYSYIKSCSHIKHLAFNCLFSPAESNNLSRALTQQVNSNNFTLELPQNVTMNASFLNSLLPGVIANRSIQSLDLSHRGLDDQAAAVIANLLQRNSSILYLYLNNNRITNAGLQTIAQVFRSTNRRLVHLDVSNNLFNADGFRRIIELISQGNNRCPIGYLLMRQQQSTLTPEFVRDVMQRNPIPGLKLFYTSANTTYQYPKLNHPLALTLLNKISRVQDFANRMAITREFALTRATHEHGHLQIPNEVSISDLLLHYEASPYGFYDFTGYPYPIDSLGANPTPHARELISWYNNNCRFGENNSAQELPMERAIQANNETAIRALLSAGIHPLQSFNIRWSFVGNHCRGSSSRTYYDLLGNNESLRQLFISKMIESDVMQVVRVCFVRRGLNKYHYLLSIGALNTPAEIKPVLNTLQTLNLSYFEIDRISYPAVFELIQRNHFLQRIDLSNNRLNDAAAEILGNLILRHCQIHALNLNDNPYITDSSIRELLNPLHGYHRLLNLELPSQISPDVRARVNEILERNLQEASQLVEAARDGNISEVRSLLARRVCVHYVDRIFGTTALIEATRNRHIEAVRLLLSAGADPEHHNFSAESARDIVRIRCANIHLPEHQLDLQLQDLINNNQFISNQLRDHFSQHGLVATTTSLAHGSATIAAQQGVFRQTAVATEQVPTTLNLSATSTIYSSHELHCSN